jgi:outer membrane protein assembly factor BamB
MRYGFLLLIILAIAAGPANGRKVCLPANAPEKPVDPQISISEAKKDKDGFFIHKVQSPFQKGTTEILVLTPDRMEAGKHYPVIYVLPVEAGTGIRWGHGLEEIKKLDLHNKLGVIFVMPTFSHLPWYCDHPTDPAIRQESYVLNVVIPFIETTYPVLPGSAGRLLLGFSKSGWGAFSLLLRHPDLFGRAAAWDAPLNMAAPNDYGMGPIFGTQKNFEGYQVSSLLEKQAAKLITGKRLAMIGFSNFRKHHQEIHAQMERLGISHEYNDVNQGKHHWNSGWIEQAVRFLVQAPAFQAVRCEGVYPHHLQGICTNDKDTIFWSFTDELVKSDTTGTVLKKVPVPNHHGDLCYHDGKLYVATNLGRFNDSKGNADNWVYVYNAEDLSFVKKHRASEVVHGAGGIAYHDSRFFVVGGLPQDVQENYVYEYDRDFKFLKKHVLKSGYTLLGIQTATFAEGHFWFGCYGRKLLKADTSFKLIGKYDFDCGLGIVGIPGEKFLVASGTKVKDKGHTGEASVAVADEKNGLIILKAEKSSRINDWPGWRGREANGVADGRKLPIRWDQHRNVLWSVKLPGWGTSSPVVHGDRVFVTSEVESDGKKSLLTLCYHRTTGKELWRHDFGFGVDQRTHEKSNLAVNTPAVTDDALYVAFGNADIARYSHDGKLQWVSRYLPMFGDPKMAWGYCLSPVVLDDAVLFGWNHHKGPCYLIGLDKQTGKVAWKKDRPIGTCHATPLVVEHHGQKDILVPGCHRLTAFEAKTHKELWRYGEGEGPYNGEIIVSPVYGDGIVFTQLWRKSRIHALRLNGNGESPTPLWVSKNFGPVEPSLLYYRGLLYALMDEGILVCYDGKTGEIIYQQRLCGMANSSPVASDGHVFVSDNEGKTFVVKAGRNFEVLATNDLGERISASPAISGSYLIYRTDSHLYCIGKSGQK